MNSKKKNNYFYLDQDFNFINKDDKKHKYTIHKKHFENYNDFINKKGYKIVQFDAYYNDFEIVNEKFITEYEEGTEYYSIIPKEELQKYYILLNENNKKGLLSFNIEYNMDIKTINEKIKKPVLIITQLNNNNYVSFVQYKDKLNSNQKEAKYIKDINEFIIIYELNKK